MLSAIAERDLFNFSRAALIFFASSLFRMGDATDAA
jgi:hypothetical protein